MVQIAVVDDEMDNIKTFIADNKGYLDKRTSTI